MIQLSKQIPNFAYSRYKDPAGHDAYSVAITSLFQDPINRRLFTYNSALACPDIVSYSMDTFAPLAAGCMQPGPAGLLGASPAAVVAVDSTDHLLFWPDLGGGVEASLIVASEDSLRIVGSVALPPPAPSSDATTGSGADSLITGVSWDAHSDDLLLTSTYGDTNGSTVPPGMALHRFHVAPSRAADGSTSFGTFQWDYGLPLADCRYILPTKFGVAAPRLTSDGSTVFVPCTVSGVDGTNTNSTMRSGVAKVALGPCASPAKTCPQSTTAVAAPGPQSVGDFFFDPVSERGVMFDAFSTNGVTAYFYDGHGPGSFIDRTNLGTGEGAVNLTRIGLDETTGRLYAINSHDGLTLLDIRRTPVGSGTTLPQFAQHIVNGPLIVTDPRTPGGSPLVFAPYTVGQSLAFKAWSVLQDNVPISSDPPSNAVDRNTYSGPVAPGSTVNRIVGGSARGYGVHSVFVGSYGGAIDNAASGRSYGNGLPLGASTPDTYAGDIAGLSLRGSVVSGQASALMADATTAATYGECTDAKQAVGSCFNPEAPLSGTIPLCSPPPPDPSPLPSSIGQCQAPCPSPLASPSPGPLASPLADLQKCEAPGTSQSWPYGSAVCSRPFGQPSSDPADDSVDGPSATTPDGSQVSTGINVAADPVAHAEVHCATASPVPNSAAAAAYFQGASIASGATVKVARAAASSSVAPPDAAGQALAMTTAEADGVRIVVPATQSAPEITVEIASVIQTAKANAGGGRGTASASRTVSISGMSVNGAGCSNVAPPGAAPSCDLNAFIEQVNALFPSELRIDLPTPDESFGAITKDGSLAGSPGGYTAVVQSSKEEQDYNAQFNEMRQPGEAALLPALRITIFDDGAQLDREVIDLAGVQDDAEVGLQVFPPWETAPPTSYVPPAFTGTGQGPLAFGRNDSAGTNGLLPPPVPPASGTATGPLAVLQQIFSGLQWLRRSPGAVLQMLATLWLLLLPALVMRRRWAFVVRSRGGKS